MENFNTYFEYCTPFSTLELIRWRGGSGGEKEGGRKHNAMSPFFFSSIKTNFESKH